MSFLLTLHVYQGCNYKKWTGQCEDMYLDWYQKLGGGGKSYNGQVKKSHLASKHTLIPLDQLNNFCFHTANSAISNCSAKKGKEGLKTLFCLSTHFKKWSWGKYINLLYIGKNQKISNAPCRVANMWMDNVTLTFDLQTSISIGFLLSPSGMCVPSFIQIQYFVPKISCRNEKSIKFFFYFQKL